MVPRPIDTVQDTPKPEEEELPTLLDPATCARKGLCPVTLIRHSEPYESHSLYYEIHGTGPERIALIMGLNGSFLGWIKQVVHLSRATDAHGNSRFSVLVFDNRGVGNSGTPRGPYNTSALAADAVALFDFIGWDAPRSINVVGISLGGMIAQEVAWKIPERIVSLVLAVTTAGGPFWSNLPPWNGLYNLTRLLFMSEREKKVPVIVEMLFPKEWLDAPADDDPARRTNRVVQHEDFFRRMLSTRVQQPIGALSQMCAGLTHSVSASRLRTIASNIPYIALATGDSDNLVDPRNTAYLARCMPGSHVVKWENTGHAVQLQRWKEFCELVERAVEEGRQRCEETATGK